MEKYRVYIYKFDRLQYENIGVILTIKNCIGTLNDYREAIIKFWCKYCKIDYETGLSTLKTDENKYTFVMRLLISAYKDYIEHCENPAEEIGRFYDTKYYSYTYTNNRIMDDFEAFIRFFKQCKVRNTELDENNNPKRIEFVNGFREFELDDLKLKLISTCSNPDKELDLAIQNYILDIDFHTEDE